MEKLKEQNIIVTDIYKPIVMESNYFQERAYPKLIQKTSLEIICIALLLFSFASCTNVAFEQSHGGLRGIDFTKGACVVDDMLSPYSKDENAKLTSIVIENLQQMSDSVRVIDSVRISTPNGEKIPKAMTNVLIDSLRKYTSYVYLLNVSFNIKGQTSNDIYVNRSDFEDNQDSKAYLDNQVTVFITIFNIHENKQIYKQKIKAYEMIDSENSLKKDESKVLFTRSSLNVAENALLRGLRDLKKHSNKR